jgi:hypothetical protein
MTLAISPDGRHLAFVAVDRRGPFVALMDVETGKVKELTETETACQAGWASPETLWVSRRRGGKIIWTVVAMETGSETGVSIPGARDCSDGKPDPQSPVHPDLKVVYRQVSQLRLLGDEYLTRR